MAEFPTPTPMPLPPRPPPETEEPRDELSLEEILVTLYDGKWWVIAAVCVALTIGSYKVFTAVPIYKADSLVQVEGKGNSMPGLQDLSEMFGGGGSGAATEMELIRSRRVMASVVDTLSLDISVTPRYFPYVGAAIARRYRGEGVAPARFGRKKLAWGGEEIAVEKLTVPPRLEGKKLRLVAGENGAYKLYGPKDELLLEDVASPSHPERAGESPNHPERAQRVEGLDIHVSRLVARAGTEFDVSKRGRTPTILSLLNGLGVSERGKGTGIITLSYQGESPRQIQQVLDAVMDAYVRQNIERRAEVAEKTLEFINAQLPEQKQSLEAAELKLNEYQRKTGMVSLSHAAEAIVIRTTEVEAAISQLTLERVSLRQNYTESHPNIVALDKKLEELQRAKRSIDIDTRSLPETELNAMRLIRDVKVANELFVQMLTAAQELRLAKSGTIGSVRVVDSAAVRPGTVGPSAKRTLGLSLFLGLGIGAALAFGHRKLTGAGVDDPDALERALGLPVFASVPFSEKQDAMTKVSERGKGALKPLARVDGSDLAMESIRSLRTSLQFALASARNHVVMVGGSRPGVGKSFVSVNLAYALADAGKKVLLIDGDLRKGQLHRYFAQKRETGLSELISGSKSVDEALRPTDIPKLMFVSSGVLPPNPSELLSSERFEQVVESLSRQFDLVIIDAPPILAVTDAVLLSRVAGVNLLVVKSGLHPLREIVQTVSRLQQSGTRPNGFVFNAVPLRGRLYGYGYGKYRYHYQYDYR